MRLYEHRLYEKEVMVSVSCDPCGKSGGDEESFLHIEKTFGYVSLSFSDMDYLCVDLCEACLYRFLKDNALLESCITPYYANIPEVSPP